MSPDDWQAHVTREAAKEIGKWLEARGRLDRPIASLRLTDLDALTWPERELVEQLGTKLYGKRASTKEVRNG